MSEHVINESDIEWTSYDHGQRSFRGKRFTRASGAEELGCSLYEIDPGKRGWLAHYHEGNEEALFVLDGGGTLWLSSDEVEHELGAGDFVAMPRGPEGQHELEAGPDGIRYLAVSTMNDPDITVYPHEHQVGLYSGAAPGGERSKRRLSRYLDIDAEVPYWDDEDDGSAD